MQRFRIGLRHGEPAWVTHKIGSGSGRRGLMLVAVRARIPPLDLGGEDGRCELSPESPIGASCSAVQVVGLRWSLGTAGSRYIACVTVLRTSVERGRRECSPEPHWRHLGLTLCRCEDDSQSPPNAAPSAAGP